MGGKRTQLRLPKSIECWFNPSIFNFPSSIASVHTPLVPKRRYVVVIGVERRVQVDEVNALGGQFLENVWQMGVTKHAWER